MARGDDWKIRAVLWDLDGTLVDTEGLYATLVGRILAELGVHVGEDALALLRGVSAPEGGRLLLEAAGLAEAEREAVLAEVLARRGARVRDEVVERTVPGRGVLRALDDLLPWRYRFGLVTSNGGDVARWTLERFGWTERFEVVVAAEDAARGKPDPEPYRLACERLGLSPTEVLAVDDSPAGVASARAAGCHTAALVGTFPAEALGGAHYVLSNPGAVPGVLNLLER